jgi:hypothetical protein
MKLNPWIPATFLVLLGLGLSACTSGGGRGLPSASSSPYPPPGFAYRYSDMAVELFWNCARPTPDVLLLEGVAVNTTQPEVRSLEFTLVGVNARSRVVTEITSAAKDLVLSTMQSTPIHLELQTTGGEVRFDLFYEYRSSVQGGNDMSGLRGEAQRVANQPTLLVQGQIRSMVRDVCSEAH